MQVKNVTLAVIMCASLSANAQMDPWWKNNTATDSSEIKKEMLADSIVNYAKSFIGVPYIWGGSDSSGFDCSGFVCYVYKKFDITLPRTSDEQFNAGVPVPYNEARPGDLILFTGPETKGGDPGHVGIVIGYNDVDGFSFIHTSSPQSGGVRISNEHAETYYYKRFLEIRRVIL